MLHEKSVLMNFRIRGGIARGWIIVADYLMETFHFSRSRGFSSPQNREFLFPRRENERILSIHADGIRNFHRPKFLAFFILASTSLRVYIYRIRKKLFNLCLSRLREEEGWEGEGGKRKKTSDNPLGVVYKR